MPRRLSNSSECSVLWCKLLEFEHIFDLAKTAASSSTYGAVPITKCNVPISFHKHMPVIQ